MGIFNTVMEISTHLLTIKMIVPSYTTEEQQDLLEKMSFLTFMWLVFPVKAL